MLNQIVDLQSPITILDLGAIEVDEEPGNYSKLLEAAPCRIIGFDPNESAHRKFTRDVGRYTHSYEFFPFAVGDGKNHELKICELATCSSIFEPNLSLCEKFQSFGEYVRVKDRKMIATYQLDAFLADQDIDFIKLDIQGAELIALMHAIQTLKRVMVVESEIEFVHQYQEQPLFSEVELFLRQQCFMFHTFTGFGSRCLKPVIKQHPFSGIRQWLWADAVFLKNILIEVDKIPAQKLLKMAIILDKVYGSYDFAFYCLQAVDHKLNTNYKSAYLEMMQGKIMHEEGSSL